MATTAAAPPFLNGTSVVPADVPREADFLRQILQIRDDVFASKHPRIHLPSKVIEQVAPRPPQTTPPTRPAINGTPAGIPVSHALPPRPEIPFQTPSAANEHVLPSPPTQRPFSAKAPVSGIDPVLLTKSDHLIRAELQLKRQQIERQIKDQLDKKGRNNDHEEREAHLNVEDCLIQAQLRVPPVSGLRPTANNSDGAESFDENSYYSSKADSWSSEEHEPSHTTVTDHTGPLTTQLQQPVNELAPSRPVQPTVIDLDDEAYEPVDDIEIYEPESALLPDETEEEDYSPPPADIGVHEPSRGRARTRRNHNNGGTNGSRQQSPHGPTQPLQNPRKRRREEKRDGKKRQQQANLPPPSPAEPVIKEEPQSPPAFTAYPDAQPSKRRALQPVPNELELLPEPEDSRMQPIYMREQEPLRRYREYEEPLSPSVVRLPQRRILRDDHDLRRVASMQYARRPYSPDTQGEVFAPEPRQMRSASHAFVERPEVSIYREASARPSAAPRYVRERSRSPVHEYASQPQPSIMMAPPPRKIVVDQYGNRYYAAPVEARESMAPPPNRRPEVDPYYQRATTREPPLRVSRGEYLDEDMLQRMPPPPRRYLDSNGAEMIEGPSYRRETSHRPVELEYRPQYEEVGRPREHNPARAYSMRPEVIRREVPEGYIRHESIQPGSMRGPQPRVREVSIVHQEPVEERRYYSVAPQARRYVGEESEGVPEVYNPRVYTRY